MSDKTYRVAIIGLGRMGSTIDDERPAGFPPVSIAAACAASPRLEVVAGADIDLMESVAEISKSRHFNIPGGQSVADYREGLVEVFRAIADSRPLMLVK